MKTIDSIAASLREAAFDLYQERNRLLTAGDTSGSTVLLHHHDELMTIAVSLEGFSTPDWEDEVEHPVAARLREYMGKSGFTVSSLAEASGVSRTTIANLLDGETSNPHRKTLTKLEQALVVQEGALDE